MLKTYSADFRVYYEDTDTGGVVYYANYLRFAERARTEMLREMGIDQSTLAQEEGILFVVRHAVLDLFKPARLDDILNVCTEISDVKGAKINMHQKITCGGKEVAVVKVVVASISKDFKPMRLPEKLKEKLLK